LTELPSQKYVDDISKSLDEMFKIYYIWGRKKVNEGLKKEIAKYDKKEADKIAFADSDLTGKEFRPDKAINALIEQLDLEAGNIFKSRLDPELLLDKVKKIAILSYSDYVKRVNTKLLVAIQTDQPYREFIKLLKADGIPGLSLKDAVDVKGYWNTVFSTNASTLFHAGYLDQVEEVKEFVAFEEYVAIIKDH